ncbi:MAG: septum formation protein Maf [Lachnospiraceae bacterium]|nr:septum formation protein Maf [Lachnospiraceae bacterium]MCI8871528.1 septum formation protein Maf [Lachnospiraceae bacterium]MCI9059483.1 septum formation protein Maf [Lachnospiraceae bacterium]GFI29694.1 septum formation protein Maf [Lachnospiraceae bacterium]
MKYRLILASASPRRREILAQVGAEFEVIPAKGEELLTSTEPKEAVLQLSCQKAEETAGRLSGDAGNIVVLGADTIVSLDGAILGKPKDKKDAVRMLGLLNGREHSVFTGVTMIVRGDGKEQIISFYEETRVFMYPMTKEQIQAYTETGEPLDKAGAYGIQGKCAVYIEKIVGDYYNVVGLPVAAIYQNLEKSGIEIL